jgi:hypothetical protein
MEFSFLFYSMFLQAIPFWDNYKYMRNIGSFVKETT